MLLVVTSQVLEPHCLGSNLAPSISQLCDLGQVTKPCCLNPLICEMGKDSTDLPGWLGGLEEVMMPRVPHTEGAPRQSWLFSQKAGRLEGLQRPRVRGELSEEVTFNP